MSWKSRHSSNDVGLVVGATDTAALRRIRNISPRSWILCPGVGAQGGSLEVRILCVNLISYKKKR
mgnify:CR=1 FL=1